MSYSMSSSSSIDLLMPPSASNWKEKVNKWFPYIWKSLVVIILVGVFSVVVYDIRRKHLLENVTKGLTCYECTSSIGMNITQPGLAFEKDCAENPGNTRMCASGEVCTYGTVERKRMVRYIRKCSSMLEPKETCVNQEKPAKSKMCFCVEDLCNKVKLFM